MELDPNLKCITNDFCDLEQVNRISRRFSHLLYNQWFDEIAYKTSGSSNTHAVRSSKEEEARMVAAVPSG